MDYCGVFRGGICASVGPDTLLSITPDWVPFAPQVIFLTGISEFSASVALITRPLRYWAGIAMTIYAVCMRSDAIIGATASAQNGTLLGLMDFSVGCGRVSPIGSAKDV
jgi:uncharacterized membrane protein